MDSSKYLVLPVDAVSDSIDSLSLMEVTSNESVWPQRNCIEETAEQLHQPVTDINGNTSTISSLTGFNDSNHAQVVPSIYQNSGPSTSDITCPCGSLLTENCDKEVLAESNNNCVSDPNQVSSGFHQMTLRPKRSLSPRHCVITLYDSDDDSSDADYSVDLAEWDYTSSEEEEVSCLSILTSSDDSDSEGETVDKDETVPSDDAYEYSCSDEDSDGYTTESSSSDEDDENEIRAEKSSGSSKEMPLVMLPTKSSSDSDGDTTESCNSDEDEMVPVAEKSSESSKKISLMTLPAKMSLDSVADGTKSSSFDEDEMVHGPKKSSGSSKESSLMALPTKKSSDSDETESCNSDEDEMVHGAEKSTASSSDSSLLVDDCDYDDEYTAFILKLISDSNLDRSGSSGTCETYDSSASNLTPTLSELMNMYGEECNDKSDLVLSKEYSSEDKLEPDGLF